MIQHTRSTIAPIAIRFAFPDFTASWVGPGRHHGEVCFGSEEARILFADEEGKPTALPFAIGTESPEAINGVAFIGENQIAASTRDEVALLTTTVPMSAEAGVAKLHCGAHGVLATHDGRFVAPLGPSGFMTARPTADQEQSFVVTAAPHRKLNYYKAINLWSPGRREILVFAVRHGGITATELTDQSPCGQIRTFESSSLDIVDVCSLGSTVEPAAVAGIGRDGTLVFIKDVLNDQLPIAVKLNGIQGVAFRVFCVGGNVIVLTSIGLYFLDGLAGKVFEGERVVQSSARAATILLEAVDANLYAEKWLYVVMPDGVLRFDVSQFNEAPQDEHAQDGEQPLMFPNLEWSSSNEWLEPATVA